MATIDLSNNVGESEVVSMEPNEQLKRLIEKANKRGGLWFVIYNATAQEFQLAEITVRSEIGQTPITP